MPTNAAVSGARPCTVADTLLDRGRPASVQTAPATPQSVAAGSATVTSSNESGRTAIIQRWFWSGATRLAWRTVPFVTRNARSRSSSYGRRPGKSSLKRNSKLNRRLPLCSAGMPTNAAVNGTTGVGPAGEAVASA